MADEKGKPKEYTFGERPAETDKFKSYTELAQHKTEGEDFEVIAREVKGSNVAIVAPHGGEIEGPTGKMAAEIAGNDHNLYVFKGLCANAFNELHVTSTRFDDPRALDLIAKTDVTVTLHRCRIEEPVVCLSGRDKKLQSKLTAAFNKASIPVETENHPYQSGDLPGNICNKNARGAGVQIELSHGICNDPALTKKCVEVIRESLKALAA
jgi:phage replication-related protein YjqB (UPF0714/DUF867 family)